MAELQTKKTAASVSEFLTAIAGEQKRKDCKTVAAIMQKATKSTPAMWGPAIIGFGDSKLKPAPPPWAYTVNPPPAPGAKPAPPDPAPQQVPGSTASLTIAQTRDAYTASREP